MTGYLEVTREPAQLELLPGASGRIDFVVTNKTGQKDYVRAVLPTPTRLTLAIVGDGEVMVENNSTTSFTIEVKAKPDAAPGDEDLSVTFVAARDSDKFSATAPSTRTVVKPKATPALPLPNDKPFPWWIVAVIGGVLLAAIAVVLVIVLRDDPKQAGEVCTRDDECGGGLSCVTPRPDGDEAVAVTTAAPPSAVSSSTVTPATQSEKKCLKPLTAQCIEGTECATGFCKTSTADAAGSVCSERIALGGVCSASEECRAPGQCKTGKCLLSSGATCAADGECESGFCASTASAPGKQCQALPEFGLGCASGRRCSANLTCGPTGLEVCLFSNDQPCQLAQSCASLFCSSDKCATAPAVGAACINNQCGHGQVCERGKCLKSTGATCAQPVECASGKCTSQVCDPFGGVGDMCTSNEQCSSGLQCAGNKCLSVVDGTCKTHSDCTSNRCKKDKCWAELRVGDPCGRADPCPTNLTCNRKTEKCETSKFVLDHVYLAPELWLTPGLLGVSEKFNRKNP